MELEEITPLEAGDSMLSTTIQTCTCHQKKIGVKWKESKRKQEGEAEDEYFAEADENVDTSPVIQEESAGTPERF